MPTTPQPYAPRQPAPVPSQQPVIPQPIEQQCGPLTVADKVALIHEAGRNLRLLEIKYDGVSRMVEPYSFRVKGTGRRLLYGWCSIHQRIHSFHLEKIENIKISEFPFVPRWEVEL
jgi:predicted DNA-binding transcriptional regulator YafY